MSNDATRQRAVALYHCCGHHWTVPGMLDAGLFFHADAPCVRCSTCKKITRVAAVIDATSSSTTVERFNKDFSKVFNHDAVVFSTGNGACVRREFSDEK